MASKFQVSAGSGVFETRDNLEMGVAGLVEARKLRVVSVMGDS